MTQAESEERVFQAVLSVVTAPNWMTVSNVARQCSDLLLSEVTDRVLAKMVEVSASDPEVEGILTQYRQLFAEWRKQVAVRVDFLPSRSYGSTNVEPASSPPYRGQLRKLRKLKTYQLGKVRTREAQFASGGFFNLSVPVILSIPELNAPLSDSGTGIDFAAVTPTPEHRAAASDVTEESAVAEKPSPENRSPSPPRYLNAGFFPIQSDELFPIDQPLRLDRGPCRLGVNVGAPWGPGAHDAPIPEDLLKPHFATESVLELDVAVHAADVVVEPVTGKIHLPREGNSPLEFFTLSFGGTGRHAVDVDLLFHGHLLQSRRTEVEVIDNDRALLPTSAWPVQEGRVTFTRIAALSPDDMKPLAEKPSRLTIVVQRDIAYNRVALRFYDGSGVDLGFEQLSVTDANLGTGMQAVRGQLKATVRAYAGGIGSDLKVLEKWLGMLAPIGRRFYQQLMPGLLQGTSRRLRVNLTAGTTIQIDPLSSQVGVPWEALYEREIHSYEDGRLTLCATFRDHGPAPEECPHRGDPNVVCPHGFWGYRYIIEQLPCRVDHPGTPRTASLPLFVRNGFPLRFGAVVNTTLSAAGAHIKSLAGLAPQQRLDVCELKTWDAFGQTLSDSAPPLDVVYFHTHGGEQDGFPYVTVGNDEKIFSNDLRAWKADFRPHRALVVVNACESANYSPDSFENLVQLFCDLGAAGVIATQCDVREQLAGEVGLSFFRSFLRQVPAGRALYDARQALLRDHLDPRGLVYSLFAAADVQLAQRVVP